MDEQYAYEDWDRSEVLPFVPFSAQSILDIGCSFGGFGASIKSRRPGAEVWGLEPNADAAGTARSRLDEVIVGHFPQDAPERKFDCVVFNDVLEHLVDPWSALVAVQSNVNPGGHVVASIPNVRHFSVVVPLVTKGRWTYREAGILDRTHLRFFTRTTMRQLFVDSGWQVDRLEASRLTAAGDGEIPKVLALLGHRGEEFRAKNYVVVASMPSADRAPRA